MPFLDDLPVFLPIQPDRAFERRAKNCNRYYATYKEEYYKFIGREWTFFDWMGTSYGSNADLHENGKTDTDVLDEGSDPPTYHKYNLWDDLEGKDGEWLPTPTIENSWVEYYLTRYMPGVGIGGFTHQEFKVSLVFALADREQRFWAGVLLRSTVRHHQILCAICLDHLLNFYGRP